MWTWYFYFTAQKNFKLGKSGLSPRGGKSGTGDTIWCSQFGCKRAFQENLQPWFVKIPWIAIFINRETGKEIYPKMEGLIKESHIIMDFRF